MEKSLKETTHPVRREVFTELGTIYYKKAMLWQRTKIETEALAELGISRSSIRAYMVRTKAYRMRADLQEIILRTLPEAADCFIDPRVKNKKNQPV